MHVFHDDPARLACRVERFEAQISCEPDGLRSGATHHHLRFRQAPCIYEHRHIMNQGGASARVKKELSFCKSIGCLQAVLLMTLRYALEPISRSVVRRRLYAPIFDSMPCRWQLLYATECLRGGKLVNSTQHASSMHTPVIVACRPVGLPQAPSMLLRCCIQQAKRDANGQAKVILQKLIHKCR